MPEVPFSLVRQWAQAQGLSAVACIKPPPPLDPAGFDQMLNDGVGTMTWLETTRELRLDPARWLPFAHSIVCCALDYQSTLPPQQYQRARYAAGKDYHSLFRKKLVRIGENLDTHVGAAGEHRACVDSAPVNERTLATLAGLGWIGRNALLIDPKAGSYRFLGFLFTSVRIEQHHAGKNADRCGSCRACERTCPTQALVDRRVISERCISYLTIEHKGVIAKSLAARFDGWWYGCDLCQESCPWNRFAPGAGDPRLTGSDSDDGIFSITAETFDEVFAGRAVRRIGYERFRRNLLVAAFSRQDLDSIASFRHDPLPLVRAQWSALDLT